MQIAEELMVIAVGEHGEFGNERTAGLRERERLIAAICGIGGARDQRFGFEPVSQFGDRTRVMPRLSASALGLTERSNSSRMTTHSATVTPRASTLRLKAWETWFET